MTLIFDTETTGFPSKGLPRTDPKQARIIQLAYVILDDSMNEVSCFKSLIKPDGWLISASAQAAHGISQQQCQTLGIPIKHVIQMFHSVLECCHRGIAHNLRFDSQLIDIENDLLINWLSPKFLCTMELLTPICKLPSQRSQYKWPKLSEAYQHCFNEELKGAHDALVDVRATARVFKWCVDNGHIRL